MKYTGKLLILRIFLPHNILRRKILTSKLKVDPRTERIKNIIAVARFQMKRT